MVTSQMLVHLPKMLQTNITDYLVNNTGTDPTSKGLQGKTPFITCSGPGKNNIIKMPWILKANTLTNQPLEPIIYNKSNCVIIFE